MRPPKLPPYVVALAGPATIVIAVVVVLHDFVFGGKFSHLNPDVPSVFLLNHCFLGESLRSGNLPSWNPLTMAGTPFAADPQSGWMYFAPMILYTVLPCSVAIRFFVVLPALVAGLGLYWFLRGETISRPAATSGGLVLAMLIAGSKVLVNLPFSDTLAWTPVLMACGARCLRARTWPSRLVWITLTALAWGQLAAAHLSHGLVVGTTALAFYCVLVARREMHAGSTTLRMVVGVAGLLVVAFPAINLAHLLPIAGYMGRASLGLGYDGMARLGAELRGDPAPGLEVYRALGPGWPLRLGTAPGIYLGAVALILAPASFWSKRLRALALVCALFGLLFFVAGLRVVAETVSPLIKSIPFADFYPHSPGRFLYGAMFAIVILCALGIEAWREQRPLRQRALMVAPGLLLWGVAPLVAGAIPSRMVIFAAGAVVGGAVLLLVTKRPALATLIPLVLAVELGGSALVGQAAGFKFENDGLQTPEESWLPMQPLPEPVIDASDYVRGGRVARAIKSSGGQDRLLVEGMGLTWMFRPAVAGVEMVQGYNPVELRRYWVYIRSVIPDQVRYNLSIFPSDVPSETAMELLQTGWVAVPRDDPAPASATYVVSDERHDLYRLDNVAPRASMIFDWETVGAETARERAADPDFDPDASVLLEEDPGIPSARTPLIDNPRAIRATDASYREIEPGHVAVQVNSVDPAVLLVRNAWDENWHATVDGEPAEVLVADYFLQGIAIETPGPHTIELTYTDPMIVPGLIGSGLALVAFLGTAGVLVLVRRRSPSRFPRDHEDQTEAPAPS